MSNSKMLIDAAHPEETRVVVLNGNRVEEFDFESASKKQLRGNIYLAKVTRVEPSLQAAFVEYGGNRHGFLAFSEIHPDYYQIPFADRQALLEEEARAHRDEDDEGRGGAENRGGDGRSGGGENRRDGRRHEGRGNGEGRNQAEGGERGARGEGRGERGGRSSERNERGQRRSRRHRRDQAPASALDRRGAGDETISETAFESDNVELIEADVAMAAEVGETADLVTAGLEPAGLEPAGSEPVDVAPGHAPDAGDAAASRRDPSQDGAVAADEDDAGEPAAMPVASEMPFEPEGSDAAADASPAVEADAPRFDGGDTRQDAGDRDAAPAVEPQAEGPEGETLQDEVLPGETLQDEAPAREPLRADEPSHDADEAGDDAVQPGESSVAASSGTDEAFDERDGPAPRSQAVEARDTREHQDEEQHGGDHEEEHVEQIGGDALSDVAPRPARLRRHYKIQEVIKRRQILLIQVVKEERGNKGAALTTYLSLAGRYSVLMPNTAKGGGISRKITDGEDRKRLKAIAQELDVPEGMGVILRTAGASRSPIEVRRDFEYLLRMWESVRELTLKSSAPSLVYEEGSLIKRSIRDLYSKEVEEIVVSGEEGFTEARDFMRMLMPGNVKSVQLYRDPQPIFAKSGVEAQLDAMFSPHVTLKSGGYLVINQTEALVAIDVNSGRSTREHNIEDTALRTNLEAADEVARQLRLRDLAGLIVVDFIDMEEGRNNRAVERRIKEALKNDRARIQIGRISHFGLLEMSRQRIRTGVLEGSTVVCPHCAGAGTVRSTASIALHVLRLVEDALLKDASYDLVVRSRAEVALYMLNQKRAKLVELEQRFGVSITVAADPSLTGMVYHAIERGELAQAPVAPAPRQDLVRVDSIAPIFEPGSEDGDEGVEADAVQASEGEAEGDAAEVTATESGEGEGEGRRRKRRRRRRGRDRDGGTESASDAAQGSDDGFEGPEGGDAAFEAAPATMLALDAANLDATDLDGAEARAPDPDQPTFAAEFPATEPAPATPDLGFAAAMPEDEPATVPAADASAEPAAEEAPKRRRSRRTAARIEQEAAAAAVVEPVPAAEEEAPAKPRRRRATRSRTAAEAAPEAATAEPAATAPAAADPATLEAAAPATVDGTTAAPASPTADAHTSEAPSAAPATAAEPEVQDPDRPKRSGWWQRAKASFGS